MAGSDPLLLGTHLDPVGAWDGGAEEKGLDPPAVHLRLEERRVAYERSQRPLEEPRRVDVARRDVEPEGGVDSDRAQGVLLDISSVDVVDSFIGRMIGNIASMSRVLDAETVVVGMRPAVAITLVELGLALPSILTALNVDAGMTLLKSARKTSNNGRPSR